MDKQWERIRYRASRRSSAEIEAFLTILVHEAQKMGYDPAWLETILELEDADWQAFISGGEMPPGIPESFQSFLLKFREDWPERQKAMIMEHSSLEKYTPPQPPREDRFKAGDWVLFLDSKGRTYLQQLRPGQNFTYHHGSIPFDEVIGKREGSAVRSTKGARLVVFRPTLKDYLLKMPRHAQVVYPKDSAVMAMWGDLFPGARVLESGLGSGALAMVILRAIGPEGKLVSYELRKSFIEKAKRNIRRFLGYEPENHEIYPEDIARARLEPESFDRVFLDLPTPTEGLPVATAALRPGGILVSLSPTMPQIQETVEWLRSSDLYASIEVLELLLRPWHVRGYSVRPAHRMVAHTAFIVVARKMLPGQQFIDDHYF